jgi:hypothetical protein
MNIWRHIRYLLSISFVLCNLVKIWTCSQHLGASVSKFINVISSYLEILIVERRININVNKVQWKANFEIRAVLWFTQRRTIVFCRRFVTSIGSIFEKFLYPWRCDRYVTPFSIRNYYLNLRKIPKWFRSHSNHSGSLNTQMESSAVLDSQCSRNLT